MNQPPHVVARADQLTAEITDRARRLVPDLANNPEFHAGVLAGSVAAMLALARLDAAQIRDTLTLASRLTDQDGTPQ